MKIKYFLLLFLAGGLLQGCFDDDLTDFGQGPSVVQFQKLNATQNFLQDANNTVYTYDVPVEVFGGNGGNPLNKDITFTISVDQANSTAIEGTHFDLAATSFTIPAGEYSANASIKVYSENLDALDPPVLVLQIDSSSETVSDNNKTKITLQAICPSNLAGSYKYINGNGRDVTITETGAGTYTVSRDNAFGSAYYISISDVCGNLKVTGGAIQSFGIGLWGNGTVNADGTITLIYTVDGYFADREMIMEPKPTP